MKPVRFTAKFTALIAGALLLTACQTPTPQKEIFRPDIPSMSELVNGMTHSDTDVSITRSHFGRSSGGNVHQWSRSQATEISNLFPTIDNPRINIYVYPHITERGDPVPGYSTAFYLFTESGQFALPGEFYQEPGQ